MFGRVSLLVKEHRSSDIVPSGQLSRKLHESIQLCTVPDGIHEFRKSIYMRSTRSSLRFS